MRFFAERMKMIVEPTGCLGFAAALSRRGRRCAASASASMISGGNVDLARFAELVSGA